LYGLLFAVALPLLAADVGPDAPPVRDVGSDAPRAAAPSPSLIPQPSDRFAERGEKIDLKEAKDGSGDLIYESNAFTARIAPDGTVGFTDKRLPGLSIVPWLPSNAPLARPSLQSSLKNLLKGKKPPPPPYVDDRLPPPETTTVIPEVTRYRPDPRENCPQCSATVPPGFAMGFARGDLTDEIERFSGKDPNRYQKAVFLAATHDRRIDMAVKTQARNIRLASAELPGRLQFIACDPRLTPRERRGILAALSREMDTTTPAGAGAAKAIREFLKRYDAGGVVCTATP
jgi:hypothetical protein